MNRKTILGIFSLLLILSFASCKSKQSLIRSGEKASSAQQLVQFIERAQPTFSTMNADRISINATVGDQQMNVSAALRIQTDSVVVLSVMPFMGIEMFTLFLYQDKWELFDRINRNFYTDSYRYFYHRFGVDVSFETLQSLFSAQLFSVGEKEVDARRLEFTPMESNKNQLRFESRTMKQTTTTHANHTIERVLLTNTRETQTLIATYNDYDQTRGINYPRHIVVELLDGTQTVMALDMRIQRVSFNSALSLPSLNPQRYTRSTLDQLLR
jgi:hypothetical protein